LISASNSTTLRLLAALLLAFAPFSNSAIAAEPSDTAQGPRFDIVEYRVEGNTLISEGELKAILAPHTGQSRDFSDVQNALQALQAAYQKQGYSAVRVILPEQTLENGIVRIDVIQQKLVSVSVLNNQHFGDDNILASLPALKVGEPPNAREVARNLRVANENPAKFSLVHFKTNEKNPDAIDATVRILDEKPSKIFLTLDNTGNEQTKDLRIGIGYQNYNMFNRDHRLSAQFITTPQSDPTFRDMQIFGFGYSIPLYEQGDSIDFLAAYSDVDAGSLLNGALNITSRGWVFGAHYNWNLDRIGQYQHKIDFGLDYRNYKPEVTFGSVNITPQTSVTPISVTYAGLWQDATRRLSFSGGVIHNLGGIDSDGGASDLASVPWLAEDDFTRYVWSADFTQQVFQTWQLHLAASGQFASDHLLPGEQFGLGGMDSVRGWHERSFSGDRGYRASLEIVSPNFGEQLLPRLSLKALAFYDVGHVDYLRDVIGNDPGDHVTIGSAGLGMRFGYGKHLLGRIDAAWVVDGDVTDRMTSYRQSRDNGDSFIHFSLAWIW
jgi:hemolysin activation/secretion protein